MPTPNHRVVGVILAAGKGARMYPFSERSPKPMLPILNRPLLVHQIEVMRDCGITDIHIVVGHLGYLVAGAIGDGSRFGANIHFVEQDATLGLAHAVGGLEPFIDMPFLMMLGDIHFQLKEPLQPLIEEVAEGRANANLVSMYETDPEMLRRNFVIRADDTGRVRRVIEKPRYVESQLKGCGVYVFDQNIFDAIRRTPRTAMRDEYEITDSIQILIDDGLIVHHRPIVERDVNLTRPEDLLAINLIELSRNGLDRLIGDNVELPAGANVHRSVIGDNVVVRHPIRIAHSLVMPGVIVDSASDLEGVVLDGEHTIPCPAVVASLSS